MDGPLWTVIVHSGRSIVDHMNGLPLGGHHADVPAYYAHSRGQLRPSGRADGDADAEAARLASAAWPGLSAADRSAVPERRRLGHPQAKPVVARRDRGADVGRGTRRMVGTPAPASWLAATARQPDVRLLHFAGHRAARGQLSRIAGRLGGAYGGRHPADHLDEHPAGPAAPGPPGPPGRGGTSGVLDREPLHAVEPARAQPPRLARPADAPDVI